LRLVPITGELTGAWFHFIAYKHQLITFKKTSAMAATNNSSKLTSLSKNALYAPLNTYLNETKRNSSKAVNANLREKALYSFIESVSSEYHSPDTSLGLENGANNGGLALNARQIEQKLSQRALTLIKGGINSSIVKSTSAMVDGDNLSATRQRKSGSSGVVRLYGSVSNKKRKRSREEMTGIVSSSPEVLVGLNQIWNKYIEKLLSNSPNSKEILSLMTSAELTGAIASVARSQSCRSHIGKVGFIIDITKNTWKFSIPKDGSKDTEGMIKCKEFKVIVVPKRDSTLVIKIPNSDKSSYVEISGNINR
jgi:RNase P/RNase MRP subunit p29